MEKENILKKIEKLSTYFAINEPMEQHISFKSVGMAKYFCQMQSEKNFIKILKLVKKSGLNYFILGNGTNTVFKNFNGIVISTKKLEKISVKKTKVYAQCGALLINVNHECLKHGLTGLEFSYGIPASMGGAVYNNAGAYGGEVGKYIEKVKVFDGNRVFWIKKEKLDFAYRKSFVKKNKLVVLSVLFNLSFGNKQQIQDKMFEIAKLRKQFQPLEYPSAGSVFKRNEEIIPAKIIDNLGLKGFNINDAYVSEKHAGFIINKKRATGWDIEKLALKVQKIVKEKDGVDLQLEIEFIGE